MPEEPSVTPTYTFTTPPNSECPKHGTVTPFPVSVPDYDSVNLCPRCVLDFLRANITQVTVTTAMTETTS